MKFEQKYDPISVIIAGIVGFFMMALLFTIAINVMYSSPLFYMPFFGFIFLMAGFLIGASIVRYIASKSFNPRKRKKQK